MNGLKLDSYLHSYILRVLSCCKKRTSTPKTKISENMSILHGDQQPLPGIVNIVHLFEESLLNNACSPTNGLYHNGKFMHYKLLNEKAARLAANLHSLIDKYVCCKKLEQNQQPVFGIDISPSFELIIAYLSVLKIGGIILPIDSNSAINRVKNILTKCQPFCLIVDSNSAFLEDTTDKLWSKLLIFDISKTEWTTDGNKWCYSHRTDDNTAAILFTSGSTGIPKDVQITHKALANRLLFQFNMLPFQKHEVCCFKTSILFVDSLIEIFSCLLKQIPLVIVPKSSLNKADQLVHLMEQHQVTRLTVVPSLLRTLLFYLSDSGGDKRLPNLQLWISNSEKLTVDLLNNFFHTFPNRRILNFYGSTETMADVAYEIYENMNDILLKQKNENLSIGRPMMNNNIYILDEKGSLLPKGSIGEICVSGANVTTCTDRRNEFLCNDLVETEGHRLIYRTGDYGRIIDDMIIYEDRRDMQVKIGGQRVNISEIEKVLMDCDSIKQVVVLCHKFSDLVTLLVAYYVIFEGTTNSIVQSQIMHACRRNLPPYMRPRLLCVRDIPLQPHTGKVDRHTLKKRYERSFKRQSTIDLMTLDEKSQKVLNIIGMNLNIPPAAIPHKASFSELGGNSITMITTIVQLKQHSLHIPIELITESSTVQDIINLVTETQYFYQEPVSPGYTVRRLNDVTNSEETIHLLVESFLTKDLLEVLLGITKEEILSFAQSLYKVAVRSGLSLVIIDDVTGEIVAGDYLYDLEDRGEECYHESMTPIITLLNKFEDPIVEQVTKELKGPLLFNSALFVHKDLIYPEQVKLCHLIEANVLKIARNHGFVGVLADNTNQVTQDICEHFFGYQLLSKFRVADYVYNERRVFAHAPKDYFIKMMLKKL